MTAAVFETDDGNAVIRVYPSRVPGLSGNARRAVIAALLPSLQAHAEYLSRITDATWTVVDAEAQVEEVTGETITDKQIRSLRNDVLTSDRDATLLAACVIALGGLLAKFGVPTREKVDEARDACAAAYSSRFGGRS